MLVEHAFVTLLESGPALDRAESLAMDLGFEPTERSAGTLVARKRIRHSRQSESVVELLERLRIDFDRGRVQVAANTREHRQDGDLHEALLVGVVRVFESSLAGAASQELALASWQDLVDRLTRDAEWQNHAKRLAQDSRRSRILLYTVLLFVLALAGLVAWAVLQEMQ
jgi:hypothetical protein